MSATSTSLASQNTAPVAHYRIQWRNAAEPASETVVEIFDEISDWWGYGLRSLAFDLHGHSEPVRARVSSYGGDLTQGLAIMAFLRNYPGTVTVEVLGVAASAATFVALGGDTVLMNAGSFFMIHNPWTFAMGNADELDGLSDTMRKMQSEMVSVYATAIRKRKKMADLNDEQLNAQIQAWMTAETWFTSEEAVNYGFADEVIGGAQAKSDTAIEANASQILNSAYRNIPQRVLNYATKMAKTTTPPAPKNESKLDRVLADLKALFVKAEAGEASEEASTDEPEAAPDPVEAAKKLLAESGYTVAEAATTAEADEEDEGEAEEAEAEKTYTEAEVQAMLASAKSDTAKKAAGKNPVNKPSTAPTNSKSRADLIRASKLQGFENLAALVKQ